MSSPATRTRPAVGRISPVIARIVVVLPAPLTPSSATTSPLAHLQVHAFEHGRLAVAGVQVAQFEQHVVHVLASRVRRRRCAIAPHTPFGR